MAALIACGWAGAVLEKVTRASGQELYAHKAQKNRKRNSRKSVRWSALPVPCLGRLCLKLREGAGQRPRRGRSPVEHRGTFVHPFVRPSVRPFGLNSGLRGLM